MESYSTIMAVNPRVRTPYTSHSKFHSRFIFALTEIRAFSVTPYSEMPIIDAAPLYFESFRRCLNVATLYSIYKSLWF